MSRYVRPMLVALTVVLGLSVGVARATAACTAGSENFSGDAELSQPTTFAGGTIDPNGTLQVFVEVQGSFWNGTFPTGTHVLYTGPNVLAGTPVQLTFTNPVASLQLVAETNSADPNSTITLTAYDASNAVVATTTQPGNVIHTLSVTSSSVNIKYFKISASYVGGGGSFVFSNMTWGCQPLAVTVASFTAKRWHGSVVVRWRTGTEVDELGFNVYRQEGNRRVGVNRRLLPALGGVSGRTYSFVDRRAPRHSAVRYWLQDVSTSGARAWHGPVRVAAA